MIFQLRNKFHYAVFARTVVESNYARNFPLIIKELFIMAKTDGSHPVFIVVITSVLRAQRAGTRLNFYTRESGNTGRARNAHSRSA